VNVKSAYTLSNGTKSTTFNNVWLGLCLSCDQEVVSSTPVGALPLRE